MPKILNREEWEKKKALRKQQAELNASNGLDGTVGLTDLKQNQLEISHYLYLNRREYNFTYDIYNNYYGEVYKPLKFIDDLCLFSVNGLDNEKTMRNGENHFRIRFVSHGSYQMETCPRTKLITHTISLENESSSSSSSLRFNLQADSTATTTSKEFTVEPFETHAKDDFKLVNLVNQVTAFDWCPTKSTPANSSCSQFLAVCTLPLNGLVHIESKSNQPSSKIDYSLNSLAAQPNLIWFIKFPDLNDAKESAKMSAIYNKTLGRVYCLKFRPDYGATYASASRNSSSSSSSSSDNLSYRIGYLLTTSSNGSAYIYSVSDKLANVSTSPSKNNNRKSDAYDVYESERNIILTTSVSFGQCTSGDWCELSGACQILLGYANGAVALFNLSSKLLARPNGVTKDTTTDSNTNVYIHPIKTFLAHESFIRVIRWSKINADLFATASLYSREVKVWDLKRPEEALINYEIFCTDLAFSLHSNDLFIAKDINLKGENHLTALDLTFNVLNHDKDDNRTRASLFYSFSTMNSLDQSDYLNKLLICNAEGEIILTRANDSKYWLQKNKLINYSFGQIAKFNIIEPSTNDNGDENEKNEKSANKDAKNQQQFIDNLLKKSYSQANIDKQKVNSIISIDLKKSHTAAKPKANSQNAINSAQVNMNCLNKIVWNKNSTYLNWYAVSGISGFLFIHRIGELNI